MKNNRFLSLALPLLMALALPLGALAQETAPDGQLEGLVTDVVDGGFVMEDIEIGKVLLNVDDATVLDGILADGEIEAGQYVIVDYDGRLTRSVPPQAHADRVGCYKLAGTVDSFLPDGVLLAGDPVFGDVIVRLNGSVPHVYQGMPITVYYNGVMAMSLPGQVNARYIVVPELTGVVSEKDGAGFTLTAPDGQAYRVLTSGETLSGVLSAMVEDAPDAAEFGPVQAKPEAEPAAGITNEPSAEAGTQTPSGQEAEATPEPEADPSVRPEADGPETGSPPDEPAGEDAVPVLPTLEWGNGDTVTVYYNGVMTKSIPPQLTAIEVLVIRD